MRSGSARTVIVDAPKAGLAGKPVVCEGQVIVDADGSQRIEPDVHVYTDQKQADRILNEEISVERAQWYLDHLTSLSDRERASLSGVIRDIEFGNAGNNGRQSSAIEWERNALKMLHAIESTHGIVERTHDHQEQGALVVRGEKQTCALPERWSLRFQESLFRFSTFG